MVFRTLSFSVPDTSLKGVDDSISFLDTLLSALGISQPRPTSQMFEITKSDPMGGESVKVDEKGYSKNKQGGASVENFKMSSTCEELMCQVQKLKSTDEHLLALNRVTVGAQVLVARRVMLMLIASLSTERCGSLAATLKMLGLLEVKPLVRLLRLVDSGRIDGTPGNLFMVTVPFHLYPTPALQCLSDALSSVVATSDDASAGLRLIQSCCRDLFTAAVGGAELVQESGKKWRRRLGAHVHFHKYENSDLSVIGDPNFEVSQILMKILTKSAAKLVDEDSLVVGVVFMMDALSACLFSEKLKPDHRLWTLQELVRIFSVTGASEVSKKSMSQKQKKRERVCGGGCACVHLTLCPPVHSVSYAVKA
jgi:hypothetical protein